MSEEVGGSGVGRGGGGAGMSSCCLRFWCAELSPGRGALVMLVHTDPQGDNGKVLPLYLDRRCFRAHCPARTLYVPTVLHIRAQQSIAAPSQRLQSHNHTWIRLVLELAVPFI